MPTQIEQLSGQEIKSISANCDMSAAVNYYGELYTWGSAKNGSMISAEGVPYQENLSLPTLYQDFEHKFKQVSVGRDHLAAVTTDGLLLTMGSEDHGKLGH